MSFLRKIEDRRRRREEDEEEVVVRERNGNLIWAEDDQGRGDWYAPHELRRVS